MLRYCAVLRPAETSGYVVEFPDLPWGITQGESVEECLERAADVVQQVAEELMKRRLPLPRPGRHRGRKTHVVTLPAVVESKLALYAALCEAGLTKAELGRRLNLHPMQVDRLFDLRHATRMERIEEALRALGKRLVVSVENAA